MVGKTSSRKADQSTKPINATVHGYCMTMSVAISWANKMQLFKCLQIQSQTSEDIYVNYSGLICTPVIVNNCSVIIVVLDHVL